ncbi:hypothetical protein CRV24_004557 [Beauveria bassiana]|nr:hypothetical protein CRV24_004557 [Beauveria bassiana]
MFKPSITIWNEVENQFSAADAERGVEGGHVMWHAAQLVRVVYRWQATPYYRMICGKIGIWTRGLSGGRTQHDSVEMRALLESAKNAYKVIHWQRKLVRRDAEFCRGYRSPSLSGDDVQDDKVVVMDADEEGEKE